MISFQKDNDEQQPPIPTTDILKEALENSRSIQELHKGPNDPVVRENNNPDLQEKDGTAVSADDAGE